MSLSRVFPEQMELITLCRKTDSVLDEICTDFDEVATEVSLLEKQDQVTCETELADLKDTLTALQKEIIQILSQPKS